MNLNKKLVYTMVCVLALQAAVPAQASIWSSVINWWNHVPEQSKRTAGIVAASVTALFALGYSAYALCKKKKKAVAPVAVNMSQEPEQVLCVGLPGIADPSQEELKRLKNEQRVEREREEARASLAQAAIRQQNALRQLQEEEKKTAAQKAAEAVVEAGKAAATVANGVYNVATSPTVVNGLSAAGSTLAQSASAVASATGSAVTTVATGVANGALSVMQYVTRESTPAFTRIVQMYDNTYGPFKESIYEPKVLKYEACIAQQDFKGAFSALKEIKDSYMCSLDPLFKEITTLRSAHAVKLRNEKLLVGYSAATIRNEFAQLTVLSNTISAIPAFAASQCEQLDQLIRQRQTLGKCRRSEGESKRGAL